MGSSLPRITFLREYGREEEWWVRGYSSLPMITFLREYGREEEKWVGGGGGCTVSNIRTIRVLESILEQSVRWADFQVLGVIGEKSKS